MLLPDDLECCPHCQQRDEGYYYPARAKWVQHRGFGNRDEDNFTAGFESFGKPGLPRCGGCHRIIRI